MPLTCHLLTLNPPSSSDLAPGAFTLLKTYLEESHHIQRLLQCAACGQLYFYEFREEIDWQGGQDPQYRTYIPVRFAAEAQRISRLPASGLASLIPRLQVDWPSDVQQPRIQWVGK